MHGIQTSIERKLTQAFAPTYLSVVNESHMHSVPRGAQTHFKVEIVSEQFRQKKILERHRLVNQVLADEIAQIRACSIYTFNPSEWETIKNKDFHSPTCAGGSKNF